MINLENLVHKGKKAIRNIICAGVAATTLFLTACPPPIVPPSPPSPPSSSDSETHVLTDEEAEDISNVGENSLTFSEPVDYSIGDIIVSGITNSTPEGLLRDVTGVSGDGKIVYTETASLEEAIENVTFTTQRKISRADVRSFSSMKGVSESATSVSLVNFNLNIDVYDQDSDVTISGNIDFDSDLVFDVDISNHHLNRLLFENITTEESELQLTALSSLENILDKKFSLAHYSFVPFTIFLPTVPVAFPVVITPKLEVLAGIKGGISPITIGATQSVDSELGVKYENGSWNIINNVTSSHSFTPIEFADVFNLKAYVGPKLDFLIYGGPGPYAEINGYLNLKLSTGLDWLELYGGLEAILGVNMKIFSKTLFDFSTNLLDFNWLLGRWEKTKEPGTLTQLTFGYYSNYNPDWSPDGTKIAFHSNNLGRISVMDTNGSNQKNLLPSSVWALDPAWSPEGSKIVFTYPSTNRGICKMNSDGTNIETLTNYIFDNSPEWSPDGSRIVFVAGTNYGIWTMDSNGNNKQMLTDPSILPGSSVDYDPVWSPDGSKIVFGSHRDFSNGIYIMNSDGTGLEKIADGGSRNSEISFSPDGTKILFSSFTSYVNPYEDIYLMNLNGTNRINLTNSQSKNYDSSFSPNGREIVFVSDRDGNDQIYELVLP